MGRWLVRRWYVLYWLAFVAVALDSGRNPGFVRHPELQPYPWLAVLVVSVILALFTAWLGAVLRPHPTGPAWVRWVNTVVFVIVLLVLVPWLVVTDGPGFAYILPFFALVTLFVLVVGVAAIAFRGQKKSDPNAPVA